MANEHGPFDNERQALSTRAAARIRAAFDASPGVGASVPECLRIMTDACEAAGVELGAYDLSFLRGVAWGETADTVMLAGMIRRAYEAGKAAALEGAATEWGFRWRDADGRLHPGADLAGPLAEANARSLAATAGSAPDGTPVAVCRKVTPWTPAPEPATGEKREGNG